MRRSAQGAATWQTAIKRTRGTGFNPLRYVVDGERAIFRGDLGSSTALWGVVAAAALVIVGVAVGTRTFKRESA